MFTSPAYGEDGNVDDSLSPFASGPLGVIASVARDDSLTIAEKLWSIPILHDNPEAPLIQRMRFIGRYHGQYARVSASQGEWDGWDDRRKRIGLVVDLLQDFRLRFQAKGDSGLNPFESNSLEDAWLTWNLSEMDWLIVQVGQFKPLWSYEWGTRCPP